MTNGQLVKDKVAYIDDGEINCFAFKAFFDSHGFETYITQSAKGFLENFPEISFDTIIVDINMPEMGGFEFYEKLLSHPSFNKCPIFFISTEDTTENKIKSLDLGAVDFLSRHFGPEEMLSRVRSRITTHRKFRPIKEFGNLRIDNDQLRAWIKSDEIKLTFLELKLLNFFIRTFPNITPKADLLKAIWLDEPVSDPTVYTHIKNLQDKIGNWDYELVSVKNRGLFLRNR